jgi:hypothetical protein
MARMRHPNLVSFMGLCTIPPCILTGKPDRLKTLPPRRKLLATGARPPPPCRLRWLPDRLPPRPCTAEYCARGSLYDVLRRGRQDPARAAELTWSLRLAMAGDAARGLLYLHTATPAIIHRDVKSPNLLVDESWRVKVGGRGHCKGAAWSLWRCRCWKPAAGGTHGCLGTAGGGVGWVGGRHRGVGGVGGGGGGWGVGVGGYKRLQRPTLGEAWSR